MLLASNHLKNEYLKSKFSTNDIIFLKESHSSENIYNECHNELKGELNFYHGTTNSCGVMIGFLSMKKFSVSETSKDSKSRILILGVTIEEVLFITVNLYNANTNVEQLKTLYKLNDCL